ncbi:MAG: dienelactone hydrolase family protein [Dehalococcoidia bacterium]|nr:dienelactone hydrolase family protein [Dehalococcoidia bacterium]
MPGNMWDEPEEPAAELDLRVLRVAAAPLDPAGTALRVRLETTRGNIDAVLHPVEGGSGAVICVGGAMGGVDGPADNLYARLPGLLAPHAVTVLRMEYRHPNDFEECVLDVLAGCSFLRGIGASELALIGHSFGGAVVIKAGELHESVTGVVSMSPQLHGTREVENLGKPLLLVHGMADTILDHEASEDIYRRALEPKRIVLFAEAGHSLIQAKDAIDALLSDWIPARLALTPMDGGREEHETH